MRVIRFVVKWPIMAFLSGLAGSAVVHHYGSHYWPLAILACLYVGGGGAAWSHILEK
jgi:hypothetical protein|uniref:Uncharacterized protein n=1 Tax=uncultured marine virus TaxID=186617 RepID=A0A0F7L605_9VIRU|nr:hypothetical protein [uncultured marine virus]